MSFKHDISMHRFSVSLSVDDYKRILKVKELIGAYTLSEAVREATRNYIEVLTQGSSI